MILKKAVFTGLTDPDPAKPLRTEKHDITRANEIRIKGFILGFYRVNNRPSRMMEFD
jgi:hypothetical protein